ncbi:MAG: TonB-dependent receptor [Bacteroidota bacterium]
MLRPEPAGEGLLYFAHAHSGTNTSSGSSAGLLSVWSGWLACALVLLTVGPSALAQSESPAEVLADTTLPVLTVTATRGLSEAIEAPQRVAILSAEDAAAAGATEAATLLERRTTAFVRRYGAGGLASLSLRGAGASQTLILLDGQRITDPQLGQLDLVLLPTFFLSGVEILHGSASALHGSDGVGGVVNLRTGAGAERFRVYAGSGYLGWREAGGIARMQRGAFSGSVAAERVQSTGDFEYLHTGFFPARQVRREGADFQRVSLYASGQYEAGQHQVTASVWHNDAERGLPSLALRQPAGERQWDRHTRVWAGSQHRFGTSRLRTSALVQQGALRYLAPDLALDETGDTESVSFNAEWLSAVRPGMLLAAGTDLGWQHAEHPSLAEVGSQRHAGVFAHGLLRLSRLGFFPALRADVYGGASDSPVSALSPRMGVNVEVARPLRLKASLGRAFRVPTFNDQFWRSAGAQGNPNLRPERAWTIDAGFWAGGERGHIEVSAYHSDRRDQIVWAPTGSFWQPENVSRVRARGLEVTAEWRSRWMLLGTSYALTDARDRSDEASPVFDTPLRYVPRYQVKPYAGIGSGPVRLDVSARFVGARRVTTDGRQQLDPYAVADAQLRLRQRIGSVAGTLSIQFENVLDRQYEVVLGYPMPPRSLRVRLTVGSDPAGGPTP